MKTLKIILPAAALFLLASCTITRTETIKAENASANASAAQNSAQPAGEIAANSSQTTAETATADALVKDIYNFHGKDNGKILNGKNRAILDKYFDKNLANLIWKDLTTHEGEVGVLDFDPFYNAQDTGIQKLSVGQPKVQGDKADVVVNFENFGNKETITYALVKQNAAWKIADIKYKDGGSLLKYFKEDAANQAQNTNTADENFEGTYQVGDTTCTVKPIKMAFEVKWAKGSGSEIFFFEDRANDQYIYTTEDKGKGVNIFALNEHYDGGEFIRADGKRFTVSKIK